MQVWDLPKRVEEIKSVKERKPIGTYPLVFRGTLTEFPIYKVSIEMPVYRLTNGRTLAKQKEYIAKNDLKPDFFNKDADSIEALQAQEQILLNMVKDQGLYDYFKDPQTVQDEPIILDENGYIINGNRRICAMKRLLEDNPSLFGKYEFIRVIFLESHNEEDIIRLEATLQIKRDIKADYSWIAQALLFRNNSKYSYDYLQRLYEPEDDIKTLLDMAAYADEYLFTRGKKDQYTLVEKHYEALKQLCKFRKSFLTIYDEECFKELVFDFMDTPEDAKGRLYATVKDIADHFDEIKTSLHRQFPQEAEPNHQYKPLENADLDLLGSTVDVEDANKTNTDKTVLTIVKKKEIAPQVREHVVQTIFLSKKRKQESQSKNAFRKNIQDSYTNLVDAKTCFNEESCIDGVLECLTNIEQEIKAIKELLK